MLVVARRLPCLGLLGLPLEEQHSSQLRPLALQARRLLRQFYPRRCHLRRRRLALRRPLATRLVVVIRYVHLHSCLLYLPSHDPHHPCRRCRLRIVVAVFLSCSLFNIVFFNISTNCLNRQKNSFHEMI